MFYRKLRVRGDKLERKGGYSNVARQCRIFQCHLNHFCLISSAEMVGIAVLRISLHSINTVHLNCSVFIIGMFNIAKKMPFLEKKSISLPTV